MQSPRRAVHISFAASLRHTLRRWFVLLNLAGLLIILTATSRAQSTDLNPSNEMRKSDGGATVTASTVKAGPPPDLATMDTAAFVHDCDRNGTAIHTELLTYTYRLKKIRREFNDHGKASQKLLQEFEAYPVRGQHILIQVRENGEPLPSSEVEWQRRRAGEQLELAERTAEQQKQAGHPATNEPDGYPSAGVYARVHRHAVAVSLDPSTLLRNCDLTSPRLERLGERDSVVFDFHARPGVTLPPRRTYLARLTGRVWMDMADKVIVRLEAWPTDEFRKSDPAQASANAEANAEPCLIYQQTKLATGAWVPSLMRINSGGNPALFDGLNWDVVFEFDDYKQFTTSVGDPKLDSKKTDNN